MNIFNINNKIKQKESSSSKTMTNITVWSMTTEDVLNTLQSSISGLSIIEVKNRLSTFGKNDFNTKKEVSAFSIFLEQFKTPLIFMLIMAAVLAGILSEWINMSVIILAVVVNTFLGFYQEYHAEQTLSKLNSYIKEKVRVRRDGKDIEIDATDLVPGDIISLTFGLRVPADARLISVNNLAIDESILTGESLPIRKKIDIQDEGAVVAERGNMVFAGTLVTEGYGLAVVYRTGAFTELGRIALLISESKREKTPLQKALIKFGWVVFVIVIFLVIAIFLLGVSRGQPIGEMLILSIAVAVGTIPEALPISLTIILSIGAERLAKKKGIMRSLSAVETLGSTNLIMTDKTGTLTEAKMRLVDIYTLDDIFKNRELKDNGEHLNPEQKNILKYAVSSIDVIEDHSDPENINFIGRSLEVNIAFSAHKNNILINNDKKEIILPFNSSYKFSVSRDFDEDQIIALGAPDVLLSRADVNKEDYLKIEELISKLSIGGNRVIGIAKLNKDSFKIVEKRLLKEDDVAYLEFLGLLVLHDPIRKEVPDAIKRIENSGVKVVIVTGDIKGTAISIARAIGWEINENNVVSGADLHQLTDDEIIANLSNIKIFARVTPEDKLRIATLYKRIGNIVAMTGDGVNDAPSLKFADIGVALGSGSDVAKSASDLVLLDDNFKTIVLAIEEGRRILSNIRKSFVYLMSSSLDSVILLGGSLIFSLPLPLTALHIIWVNFFTGSLPALSFAFDEDFDNQTLVRKNSSVILNKDVVVLTAGVGVLTSVMLFALYAILIDLGMDINGVKTIIFACFALYILVSVYSFRSLTKNIFSYPVFSNKVLNKSVFFGFLMYAVTIYIPFMRDIFGLAVMPKEAIFVLPLWFVFNIFLIEITKFLLRKFRKNTQN